VIFFMALYDIDMHKLNLGGGSKHVTRNQRDHFGKGLHVHFPKINFYMQMNF
jgi:hypothetical protein